MNKETYERTKEENRKAKPEKTQRVHNRESRRAMGMRKPTHRNAKAVLAERGTDYREAVAMHNELAAMTRKLRRFIYQCKAQLDKLDRQVVTPSE